MLIYAFDDYKKFCRAYIAKLPKQGHGELARIAKRLEVNAALISQIINGPKDFTTEQALELATFWGLRSNASDFFVLLVERERAGTNNLKALLTRRIEAGRSNGLLVKEVVRTDHLMSEEAKATFYSSWSYAAARLLASIPGQHREAIATRLRMTRVETAKLLEFLENQGLVVIEGEALAIGPNRTHLEFGSPFLSRHHLNWRLKGLQKIESLRGDSELMFTAPLVISRNDFAKLRERLLEVVKELSEKVKDSPSENLYCLNIDLFEV